MSRFFIFPGKLLLIVFFLSKGISSFSQTILWSENFSGLADGTTVDNGSTSWSVNYNGRGHFDVRSNKLEGFYMDDMGEWTSEVISISSVNYAEISMDIDWFGGGGFSNPDTIRVYYKLDGGEEVLFYENILTNFISSGGSATLSKVLKGSTVQIIIRTYNDYGATFFSYSQNSFDNIQVKEVTTLYSRASGDWNNGNNWSIQDFSGTQTPAGYFPTRTEGAIIGNGDDIDLRRDESASFLELHNNGDLDLNGNTIRMERGGDLIVENGGRILDNNVNSTIEIVDPFSINVEVNNSNGINIGGLVLNDEASLNVFGSGSISFSDDIIIGDNVSIVNDLTGSITTDRLYFQDDNASFVNNGDLSIANRIEVAANNDDNCSFENNGVVSLDDLDLSNADFEFTNNGTVNMSGVFTAINNGSNFYNNTGATWNYGGATFDNSTRLFCDNGTNTFNYNNAGVQNIITPQDAYSNLKITGSGPKTAQGNLDVKGDLTLENTALIDFDDNGLTLIGDFIIDSFNPNAVQNLGATTLTGTTDQTFGGSNDNEYATDDLIVSQSAGSKLVLQRPIRVTNSLTLNSGVIESSSINSITLSDDATSNDGNANSYIDGPIVKEGDDDFVFPTGDGSVWAPIGIANLTGGIGTTFTAEYHNSPFGDVTSIKILDQILGVLLNVSGKEYWDLSNSGSTSEADVSLYWKDADESGIEDFDNLMVAHYDGTLWENFGQSYIAPGSEGNITATGVSDFSPFTFGSTNGNNPLPIELKDFNAKEQNGSVTLSWTTISELNNDYFTLERSTDGINYEVIGEVNGAGTTDIEQSYKFVDDKVQPGTYYYKLKQSDFDGAYEYFTPVYVQVNSGWGEQFSKINVYPNPISGSSFTLAYSGLNIGNNVNIEVRDISGRKVFENSFDYTNTSDELQVEMNRKLNRGVYTVILTSEEQVLKKKILVN